ncbi:MAG: amidase [Pseudobdellovibrionaceae bacterium]
MKAYEIAAQIRSQEKTVLQVVEEHISQIQKVNSTLNAVIETSYDQARESARSKDQVIAKLSAEEKKNLPPLFGVPFTCKEMIANRGLRSTMGSIHHRERVLQHNASVIDRILAAGGIFLGTTNVPELGFWFECDNVVYGETRNPYDLKRTCGGSSGGEGAIISAGASAFGIGSDIGGSIRLPAAFCGIFGHKPSDRVVPLTGHFPLYPETAHEIVGKKYPFTVMGPLARSAADLEILFRLIVGPDEIDQNTKTDFRFQSLVKDPEFLKVFFLPSPRIHGVSETEDDISRSVQHAARYLKELGSSVEEADSKLFLRGLDFWTARAWSIEAQEFTKYLSAGEPLSYHKEFLRLMLGRRKYTLPSLLTGFLDQMVAERELIDDRLLDLQKFKSQLSRMLGRNGVILMPTHPRKAPLLHSTYTRPFDFICTGVINALGFPSTAVPMGLSSEGLPLSLQVVAAEDQDHLCLSVASMLETGFGGYQAPKASLS